MGNPTPSGGYLARGTLFGWDMPQMTHSHTRGWQQKAFMGLGEGTDVT